MPRRLAMKGNKHYQIGSVIWSATKGIGLDKKKMEFAFLIFLSIWDIVAHARKQRVLLWRPGKVVPTV